MFGWFSESKKSPRLAGPGNGLGVNLTEDSELAKTDWRVLVMPSSRKIFCSRCGLENRLVSYCVD